MFKNKKEELVFKLQRIAANICVDAGLIITPERFVIEGTKVLIDILTKEEELYRHPSTWWQMFKSVYFPKWLLRLYPVKYTEVWTVHKFPELTFPTKDVLGKEFVHLKIIEPKD